jgi:hypothetical protein
VVAAKRKLMLLLPPLKRQLLRHPLPKKLPALKKRLLNKLFKRCFAERSRSKKAGLFLCSPMSLLQ